MGAQLAADEEAQGRALLQPDEGGRNERTSERGRRGSRRTRETSPTPARLQATLETGTESTASAAADSEHTGRPSARPKTHVQAQARLRETCAAMASRFICI